MSESEINELNINNVVAEFVQHNLDRFFKIGANLIKGAAETTKLHLDRTYKSYLNCVAEKCSKTKSFIIRGEPKYLYEFYVPLSVNRGDVELKNLAFAQLPMFSLLVASGGCGKTMLMKHLVLNSLIQKQKVPIYIQLQQINQTDINLNELIRKSLAENKFDLDATYITKALDAGHFAIFLDGFDEVIERKRFEVSSSIREFVRKHDKNYVIVSSRQDRELSGWQDFTILNVNPLSIELACELVDKIPYDQDLKARFIDDLQKSLYVKHKSFLSNPLLLTIMLLTYGQSANIPEKISVFYNQAFEVLFERHDTLKSGYSRFRRTKLDIQDFGRIFSAFCLQTYDNGQLEFSRMEALRLIQKAMEISSLAANKDDFLHDCQQAVCLFIEEGLNLSFSHRSFQEYFTARFVLESSQLVQQRLIDKYKANIGKDNVFLLIYEMRPELIESSYLLHNINELLHDIDYKDGEFTISHFLRFMRVTYGDVTVQRSSSGPRYVISPRSYLYSDLVTFILKRYSPINKLQELGTPTTQLLKSSNYEFVNEQMRTYKFTKFTVDDKIVIDLFKSKSIFSVTVLEYILKCQKDLSEKAVKLKFSLDDILSASKSRLG